MRMGKFESDICTDVALEKPQIQGSKLQNKEEGGLDNVRYF
jgi:hypothetical protein